METDTPHTQPDDVDTIVRDLGLRINEQLPRILRQLLAEQTELDAGRIHLECSLLTGQPGSAVRVASVELATGIRSPCSTQTLASDDEANTCADGNVFNPSATRSTALTPSLPESMITALSDEDARPTKRRATGGLTVSSSSMHARSSNGIDTVIRRLESDGKVFPQRKKKPSENPTMQPSTLNKFICGVWESIFSGMRMDPAEVIEQWQAIESSGRPKLLTEDEREVANDHESKVQGTFGRINVLARKISQTSRTCRSLEVIVQAHWVQAFDDHVLELSLSMPKEKAKKAAISEACVDFNWSEKELRNKTAIWRGYHDIQNAAGWAALVFAGMGLYRFCKYKVSFTEETFQTLRGLKHRFEVAADTLHPRWRSLLAIVGTPTERKYTGHPHEWVVCGPNNEALPLPTTYHQWDKNFSYTHLDESCIDEEAWGLFDPRRVASMAEPTAQKCQTCGEHQSDDPRSNACNCFPNLYGTAKAGFIPVQVFRTPNGKNNGLVACCPFERGVAIGEFIGQITSGLSNTDVMVGQTDKAAYQIWQGKQGNHTRFVNHSCQPNSQFERFVWLGTQRIVLVSRGIDAEEEITVDYSDTYWKNLDKECLCAQAKCRYRRRAGQLLTPPDGS